MEMKQKGFYHMPPVELLVASHLHLTQRITLPLAADHQGRSPDRAYKSIVTSVGALKAFSVLLFYQPLSYGKKFVSSLTTASTPPSALYSQGEG